ncbi:MAG: DsbE family thiol:disulfide interchange protein [Pseudomonadota bacterium]
MARISPLVVLPPLIFAGIAGLFFAGMMRDDPNALPSTREGAPAPNVVALPVAGLPIFGEEELAASGIKIVNFWASWCAPCRAEHPNLIELGEDYPVYGINGDVSDADAVAFLDELGNPFDGVVGNARNAQSIEWGVYAFPETFFIDGDGNVILHFRGPITQRSLETRILPALDAAVQGS